MILLAILAATIIASVSIAIVLLLRHTTINVILRKDPDMATIKERLAALEAARADHDSTLANTVTTDQLAVVKSSIDSLTDRVSDIDAEIGTDPVASAAPAQPGTDNGAVDNTGTIGG